MKKVLLWLWQFPQHILALIIYFVLMTKKILLTRNTAGNRIIITDTPGWGISLGRYIFMDSAYGEQDIDHEKGHSIQSLYWGPLYLIVIGIPSAVFNNLWDRLFHKNWPAGRRAEWYYSRYPEKQADRLGGVERGY